MFITKIPDLFLIGVASMPRCTRYMAALHALQKFEQSQSRVSAFEVQQGRPTRRSGHLSKFSRNGAKFLYAIIKNNKIQMQILLKGYKNF